MSSFFGATDQEKRVPAPLMEAPQRRFPANPRAMSPVILLFCVLFIGLVWGAVALQVRFEHKEAIAEAVKQNSNLAIAFEEQTIRTIDGIESITLFLEYEYTRLGNKVDIAKYVDDGIVDDHLFTFLGVIDEHGEMVAGDAHAQTAMYSSRDHFPIYVGPNAGEVLIGQPAFSRADNRWGIPITRRMNKPDGSFGGVILAVVDPSYFTNSYQLADLGANGLAMLIGLDGIARASSIGGDASFGTRVSDSLLMPDRAKAPVGNLILGGDPGNGERYVSYRTLHDYPLMVAVGSSKNEILATASQHERRYFWGAGLLSVFVLGFAALLIVLLHRSQQIMAWVAHSESRFAAIFDQAAIGIMQTALDGRILRVNQKLCDILGYSKQQLLEVTTAQLSHPRDIADDALQPLLEGLTSATQIEQQYLHHRGTPISTKTSVSLVRDEADKPQYLIRVIEDITERRILQKELLYLMDYDRLTQLPNRALIFHRLEHALAQAKRRNWIVGVIYVDLDRFKVINDTMGREAGDNVLKLVADRLKCCVRADDIVGRVGDDEFVVIVSELARVQDCGLIARKMNEALAEPCELQGHETFPMASLGIATYLGDSITAEALVQRAEAAMLRAKDLGRNTYQFYAASLNENVAERLKLENQLRRAIPREEFLLHFQPKVDLVRGEITGFEALLRWQPDGEPLVSPAEFIPLLEESGLIVPVGELVLEAACAQIRVWQEAGLKAVPVAVNLSAKQFQRQDLCATVKRVLNQYVIDPSMLELEITESAAMQNAEQTIATLRDLKLLGVRIAIDDFGTGHSSLSYLKRFPVDAVKIDRSFITELATNMDDASIAQAVIGMSHTLRLKVIAEGVEDAAQLEFLTVNDCDEIQGFYFSRPLPASATTALLAEGRKLVQPTVLTTKKDRALLLVGSDETVLVNLQQALALDDYHVWTAASAQGGFALLTQHHFGVIIAQQHIEDKSGVEFLRQARKSNSQALHMIVHSDDDLDILAEAVNDGVVYKLVQQPWDEHLLHADVAEAFRRYEAASESERLQKQSHATTAHLLRTNKLLETMLGEQWQVMESAQASLRVIQDALQSLPIPLLGVDDSGFIVLANASAEQYFGDGATPLLDTAAVERLPSVLCAFLGDKAPALPYVQLGDQRFGITRRPLGSGLGAAGTLLVVIPQDNHEFRNVLAEGDEESLV